MKVCAIVTGIATDLRKGAYRVAVDGHSRALRLSWRSGGVHFFNRHICEQWER